MQFVLTAHCDLTSRTEGPSSASTRRRLRGHQPCRFPYRFRRRLLVDGGKLRLSTRRVSTGRTASATALFFDYTWAGNGWTATIGLEDGFASGEAGAPDVYGGITYSGSGWYLAGIWYHDSSADAGAWKVRADYDFGTNGFAVGGWYMSDDGDTDYVKGHAWASPPR